MARISADTRTALSEIRDISERLEAFWSKAHGWAPSEAAALLARSRLNWLTSFNRTLPYRVAELQAHLTEPAALILAWVHLRALVEGHLKLLLAVYLKNYLSDPDAPKDRHGAVLPPDGLALESLRQFFAKRGLLRSFAAFLDLVQQRGNAIHAFRERELGTAAEFLAVLTTYHAFLVALDEALPYP